MSYTTWLNIKVVEHGLMTKEQVRKAFNDMCDEAGLNNEERDVETLSTAGEDNNYCSQETFVEKSAKYPEIILEGDVDGTSEESDNQQVIRIQNGRIEQIYMKKTFEPFTEILTLPERKFKDDFPYYDQGVANALTSLHDVSKSRKTPMNRCKTFKAKCLRGALKVAVEAVGLVLTMMQE